MNSLKSIMIELGKRNISTSIHYHKDSDMCYLDLETGAKSHLYLFENGEINGRYDYKENIDLRMDIDSLLYTLCEEFNNALHGRNYYQSEWGELCREVGISIDAYI